MSQSVVESSLLNQVKEKILNRTAKVGVFGLGYVGLPFAVEAAKAGFTVVGYDRKQERADLVNQGESYIQDVATSELKELVNQGLITATVDTSSLAEVDVIIVAVPTPLTKNLTPDLQYVRAVTKTIGKHIRKGQFICLESTTYPGTTNDEMRPILEESGLIADQDFYLAHSPERVDPGNKDFNTQNTTKVVGGVGPNSLEVAKTFYEQTIAKVVTVSSADAAELVKVFENTFRAVNIALVNEMAKLCDKMNLNVWEVLDAANSKPFGIMPFYPGPGVGGHCIPLDPHYLEWKAREYNFTTRFIALAGEINRSMPRHVVEKAARVLNEKGKSLNGSHVLVLGVAYKKDISDWRESPSTDVIHLLDESGSIVSYSDPFCPAITVGKTPMESVPLSSDLLARTDLVIIATGHTDVDYKMVVESGVPILDTRNITKPFGGRENITLL